MGLKDRDDAVVRRGWTIVEKNQAKIYNLVMDMLSYSKDREPALEPTDLNETMADVIELMQSRAEELNVALDWKPARGMPEILIDADGIHRAALNIITNAIDAAESVPGGRVVVSTSWDEDHAVAEKWGAWGEKSLYGRKYMGIVRSAFVVDEAGKLSAVFYKVSPKETVPKVEAALKL